MRTTLFVALVGATAALAASGCALPYFTSSHVDPADGAWVVVVADPDIRGGPLQYRMDEHPPEAVLAGLVEMVESRDGYGEGWVPSPDGRWIAFEHVFPEGPGQTNWKEHTRIAETAGPPWRIRDVPGVGAPLAWSPDGSLLVCRLSERTAEATWRNGFAVVDVATSGVRPYWDVQSSPCGSPVEVAFSQDGAHLAFPREPGRSALLALASGEVADAALPEAGQGATVIGWLLDGRIAYRTADDRVLFARLGDSSAEVFPTDPQSDFPMSSRPDGGAVLCRVERNSMFSMYKRMGALVRYADGGREDLDFVKGHLWSFWHDIAVWFPAPGLAGAVSR